jgi:hypothetical protein
MFGKVLNGIPYDVDIQDYEGNFSLFEGQSRSIVFQCPFARNEDFVAALLGVPSVAGGPGQNFLRASPMQWPGGPTRLVCTRARVIGVGTPRPGSHLIDFTGGDGTGIARIWATFEVPRVDISGTDANNQVSPQPWAKWHVEGMSKVIVLNKQAWKFLTNNDNPPKDPRYRLHQEKITVTFELVPWIWTSLYRALAKNVNNNIMFGWGVGQVLFDGYEFDQEVNVDATYAQKVSLTFLAQNFDWNKQPRDDDAGFDFVVGAVSTTTKMYPYSDLTPLLSFSS